MPSLSDILHAQKTRGSVFLAAAILAFSFGGPAWAENTSVVDILPASSQENYTAPSEDDSTHPPLRLTPDKSEILHLDRDAGSVILGNPEHASILVESPTLLVVVPKTPGATYFTILDKGGDIIMQRHVIIASPKENYVRVRKTCTVSDNDACSDTNVYYCPDMCHNIAPSAEDNKQQGKKDSQSSNKKSNSSSNAAASSDEEEAVDE